MSKLDSIRRFSVLLDDPAFAFCAAHFVAFPVPDAATGVGVPININGKANINDAADANWLGEPIHGHDFRAVVRVAGPRDASGCVVDFCAARRILIDLVSHWNHRLFLARRTPCAAYREAENDGVSETEIRWNGLPTPRRWVFPSAEVVWLDATNATAEEIAATLLERWIERLVSEKKLAFPASEYRFSLQLQETPGAFAEIEIVGAASEVSRF